VPAKAKTGAIPTVSRGFSTPPDGKRPGPRIVFRIVWNSSVVPLGDCALTVDVPDAGGDVSQDRIRCLADQIVADAPGGVSALVPAIRTLTVHYDPVRTSFRALSDYLVTTLLSLRVVAAPTRAPIVIPVVYGGEFGPDLEYVASVHDTTPDAVVAAHTAGDYSVAMIGFLPGFPYLNGLATALHTPRRAEPRTAVPAGSVGIGGSSTGVYPFASPGGWHLIGRTSRALFDARRNPPSLLIAGDRVRFAAISPGQFRETLERP
jgi:inhibitor of KinA